MNSQQTSLEKRKTAGRIELSREHIELLDRRRPLINQYDARLDLCRRVPGARAAARAVMEFTNWPGQQINSVWLDVDGDKGYHPSKWVIPYPVARECLESGQDPVGAAIEEARNRGLEVFVAHRMNQPPDLSVDDTVPALMKEHSDWLINWNVDPSGPPNHTVPWQRTGCVWNYAVPAVREHRRNVVCELAENYPIDGVELDWTRGCPYLPVGKQWAMRDALTDCVRLLRTSLQDVARKRGRPLLLAARVPETIAGCHFDGFDVETWVDQRLVDILVLGDRNLDVDLPAFRRLTAGTPIKLYPSYDTHHASDAYRSAPIEVLRGVAAKWWHQGADGIHVMNFLCSTPEKLREGGLALARDPGQDWRLSAQAFRELGDPETLRRLDKTYVVQRRAGGGGGIYGFAEERGTQYLSYNLSNMEAPLPARLGHNAQGQTLFHIHVADAFNADADSAAATVALRLLLSDPKGKGRQPDQSIEPGLIRDSDPTLMAVPIAKEHLPYIEVRLNNLRLGPAVVKSGWLTFEVPPRQLALGDNLVSVHALGPTAVEPYMEWLAFNPLVLGGSPTRTRTEGIKAEVADQFLVERLELDVKYH